MKRVLAISTAVAIGAAAVFASSRLLVEPASSASVAKPSCGTEVRQYGHISSLTRKGRRFELRFDPALWLGGVTAQRAAVEDGLLQPGEPVPNDYYIRDQDHRLLTYVVPPNARVTVITQGIHATPIPVAELAQIVKGRNPRHRPLYAPKLGFWIRAATDTVRSLDQQYQP
jgi:hypothetical protein